MEIICKLLEETIQQYRRGTVKEGDKALTVAVRLRKEIDKAETLIPTKTTDRTAERH